MPWTASRKHPFDVNVVKPRWPPLFSTAPWLPRLKVRLTNTGGHLDRASVSAEMANYNGDIGSVASAQGWTDEAHFDDFNQAWEQKQRRILDVRVPANKVPAPGTYLIHLRIMRIRPSGTIREDLERQLQREGMTPEEVADLSQRAAAAKEEMKQYMPHVTMDGWDQPRPGQLTAEEISNVTVLDYVRVEPFSNVLTLLGVVVAALAALATLALVLLTWVALDRNDPEVVVSPNIIVPAATSTTATATTTTVPPTTSGR